MHPQFYYNLRNLFKKSSDLVVIVRRTIDRRTSIKCLFVKDVRQTVEGKLIVLFCRHRR